MDENRKKRAGIITLYHNNNNYGGIAQAWALQQFIQKQGFEAELISYQRSPMHRPGTAERIREEGLLPFARSKMEMLPEKLRYRTSTALAVRKYADALKPFLQQRREAFARSRELAAHSEVYTEQTISGCVGKYDLYVSGSDQIWKPGVLQPPYVFAFLPDSCRRISYASSIAVTGLPDEYGLYLKQYLDKYEWVSVREQSAKEYLDRFLQKETEVVVDPTLLLSGREWEQITARRQIRDPYIFVYMLGEDARQRRMIRQYAKKTGRMIVNLPHVEGHVVAADIGFGDRGLYDVDLPAFLSLIRNADCVCTDSFHAVIFSSLFRTEFLAFERIVLSSKASMNSRMDTLLSMLGAEHRLIRKKDSIRPENLRPVDFDKVQERREEQAALSAAGLCRALRGWRGANTRDFSRGIRAQDPRASLEEI